MRAFLQYDATVAHAEVVSSYGKAALGPLHRFTGGVEVTVLFGDFTPPRKPRKLDGQPLQVDDASN
jgi:hypothetical protein